MDYRDTLILLSIIANGYAMNLLGNHFLRDDPGSYHAATLSHLGAGILQASIAMLLILMGFQLYGFVTGLKKQ